MESSISVEEDEEEDVGETCWNVSTSGVSFGFSFGFCSWIFWVVPGPVRMVFCCWFFGMLLSGSSGDCDWEEGITLIGVNLKVMDSVVIDDDC